MACLWPGLQTVTCTNRSWASYFQVPAEGGNVDKMYWLYKSNVSLYSLYYAEACNEFAGLVHLRVISPRQHNYSFRRNNTAVASSSVRRIFERWGGARKFENNEDQKKISPLRISPFFCPKLPVGEDQKKRSSLNISPVFWPKITWRPNIKNKKIGLYPDSVLLCAQTFCPSYKGGGHAAILHTILC